ncbi:His Kinase A (phospho-acceptor) domain-containing protein [Arsukibacterium tuosuense]|uniref:histidine kinase n=1 Tax=Arsukibacterium tuosuense TaxID=1323745 RepID=A0A285IPV8_9GAMM|nr:HAMP domain-containing sensor histidine kinase [Arsukibacterium tuosuense]SNY49126.1 His Kinase A (phospho-acceptor) domain-containing protein [Arsukibacterium tuosuense]
MTKLTNLWRWPLASLQRRLFFYVVLPMLLLAALAMRFGLSFTNTLVADSLRSDLELIGRAIRVPISDALLQQDTATINTYLESVFTIGRVYGASVYDTEGGLVAATGVTERDLSHSLVASEVVRTGQLQDSYRSVSGESVFSQFLPIVDRSGRIHGLLQINRKQSDFSRSLSQMAELAWLSWLALAVLSLLIMWLGHNSAVGQPVARLVASMRRVAAGDSQHRADTNGPIELRELSRGLNSMLDHINNSNAAILRQQQEREKLAQQLKAQETMAAVGQVVSGVAHELGAPLSVIDGRAQRLLRQQTDDDSKRQLEAVRGQVARLNRMVQQLQAFAHTPVAPQQQIALDQLLQQALHSLSFEQQEQDVMPTLAEGYPQLSLQADVPRLELALVNVLRNAMQAADSRVELSAEIQGTELWLRVQDDGPGLPESLTADELVAPFVSTKVQGKGTGLGLAIVQQIVQAHQGRVLLHNLAAGGCEVCLILPLTSAALTSVQE